MRDTKSLGLGVLSRRSVGIMAPALLAHRVCGQLDTVVSPQHSAVAGGLQEGIHRVEELFAAEYRKDNLAGVTIGVVAGQELIWTKSFGLADIALHTAATADSTYRIGSITKQITAIMLLQLVASGRVALSDSVAKYWPTVTKIPAAGDGVDSITLLQLATHTSGLSREPEGRGPFTVGAPGHWEEALSVAITQTKLLSPPGARYWYSNIGYAILGRALSNAAGQPYTEYIQKNILLPLGMTDTGFGETPERIKHLAKGYVARDGIADPGPALAELQNGRGYRVPNGGLFTTVRDLARFVSFEMGYGPKEIMPWALLRENHAQVYHANGKLTEGVGIGFMVSRDGSLVALGHSGSVAGYAAAAYFNPDNHRAIITLRNCTGRGFGLDSVMIALDALSSR